MSVQIKEFENIISTTLRDFILQSNNIGEPITSLAALVECAFEAELTFIRYGLCNARPTNEGEFGQLLIPLTKVINAIQELRSKHRQHELFNNLSTVSESISALSWIAVAPAPAQFVKDMKESGEYYGNRVLSGHRGDVVHSSWVNQWCLTLGNLEKYVRAFHTTGFSWGVLVHGSGPCNLPPPPPPPPIAPIQAGDMADDDRAALLRDLNMGTDITKRLKKIGVEGTGGKVTPKTTGPAKVTPAKKVYPPKFALEGKKWCVEHQKDNRNIIIDQAAMSESVAVYRCENTVVQVKSKVNYITVDACKKTSVVLNDIISAVEIIHSDNVQIQCSGKVPLINVDNSEGVQVFTNKQSEGVEIISSKSSSMNVCVTLPDGDYKEHAVPEQIKTVIVGGKLKSSIVEKN